MLSVLNFTLHSENQSNRFLKSSVPGQRSNYRPDKDAFLFVLNGTNSTFSVTKPTRNHIETSTSVQSSRGLVFGETPHDLIIGNSSVMRSAAYHGNVSFGLLDRLQRGNIVIDDIEVLYSKGI